MAPPAHAPLAGPADLEAWELEAGELEARWFLPALRPDTGRVPPPCDGPGEPPESTRAPVPGSTQDRLWREFWVALMIVLVVAGLTWAATAVAGGPASGIAVRALGWPALVLPVCVLLAGLRGRRHGGARGPDLAVAVLGLTLEASALLRLHSVLGVLLGVG